MYGIRLCELDKSILQMLDLCVNNCWLKKTTNLDNKKKLVNEFDCMLLFDTRSIQVIMIRDNFNDV